MSQLYLADSVFDTSALGISVAKICGESSEPQHLENILRTARDRGYKVAFWSVSDELSPKLLSFAQKHGDYCSTKVKYKIQLSESLISALGHSLPAIHVTEYEPEEPSPELIQLGLQAGQDSRFHNDPNLSYQQFERLYTALVKKCTRKLDADVVLTAIDNKRAIGFVAVKKGQVGNIPSISLLAIHPEYRRKNIGKSLVVAALKVLYVAGYQTCEVTMQSSNKGARSLCEVCGGLLVSKSIDFHFWFATSPFNDMLTSDIPGNKPYVCGGELTNLEQVFSSKQIATHGKFGEKCQRRLETELGALRVLLVTSGTSALELCSLAIDTRPGDEIIMPAYTFVSTANAFVNHGGTPVFVDIRRDTQNIDEHKIERAITPNTKAIVVVHYAGVPCEMDTIMDIAFRHGLYVIEDNAHGIFSTYKGRFLGTIGHLAAHSFHYTKNISCGEGGAVFVNRPELISPCQVAWEKGTNRFDFLTGKVDKYAWVNRGSSFVMSEINAAVLDAQVRRQGHS